ncbi:MAG: serine protease [Desulfitobacterium sp.]|nr:serine protease [Desulfitobacterium sp.]
MKRKHLILTISLALAIPFAAAPLNAALKVSNTYGSSLDYGSIVSLSNYKASTNNSSKTNNPSITDNPSNENTNNPGNSNNNTSYGDSLKRDNNQNTNNSTKASTKNNNNYIPLNKNNYHNSNNNSQYSNSVSLKDHKVNIKGQSQKPSSAQKPSTPSPTAPQTPKIPPTKESIEVTGSTTVSAQEQAMVNEINKERAAAGLAPLQISLPLAEVAQLKANDMKTNGYFSHTSPTYGSPFDMLRSAGISFRGAGENIAINSSVEGAMVAFMSSEGHRRNILNPGYTHVGIGVVQSSHGTYFVQIFATL